MLNDVRRRRLELPERGLSVALLDWGGDGPLALLNHANGFCAGLWAPVVECLRPHFRVIAMDARGHGDTSKPEGAEPYHWHCFGEDVRAVATALREERGGERLALGLGHSFGGTSILMAVAEAPDLYERVICVDPVLMPPPGFDDARRLANARRLSQAARQRRHVWTSREEAREAWAAKPLFAGWDPRALDLYVAEALAERSDGRFELKCPAEVEAAVFELGPHFDPWPLAPRICVPALLLWAVRGDFPRQAYEAFAAQMPQGRVEDLDMGHLAPMECPERVARAVLEFCGIEKPDR